MSQVAATPQPLARCFTNKDTLQSIIPHVCYASMRVLIRTCKFVNQTITAEHIKNCRLRARLIIGNAFPVPDQRFSVLFKIYNLKEEPIEMGVYQADSQVLMGKFNGKLYIGVRCQEIYCKSYETPSSLFSTYMERFQKGRRHSREYKIMFNHRSLETFFDSKRMPSSDDIFITIKTNCQDLVEKDGKKHYVHSRNSVSHLVLMHPFIVIDKPVLKSDPTSAQSKVSAVQDPHFGVLFKMSVNSDIEIELGLYRRESLLLVCRFKNKYFIGSVTVHSGWPGDDLVEILHEYTTSHNNKEPIKSKIDMVFRDTCVFSDDHIDLLLSTKNSLNKDRNPEFQKAVFVPYC